MSTTQGRKSSAALGQQEKSSVFDFLYHDARRIGSFLSQFNPQGHLQSLTQSKSVTETASDKAAIAGTGGIPLVANINATGEIQSSEAVASNVSKTFDPLWSNALAFLDYLEQHSLLQKSISAAGIGQFVRLKGDLCIAGTGLVQKLYATDAGRARAYLMPDPTTNKVRPKAEVDFDLSALKESDYQVQAYLQESGAMTYFNLKQEGLITSASDLQMKYGVSIDGTWTVIGIKDANPQTDIEAIKKSVGELQALHKGNAFFGHNLELLIRMRFWMGRPAYCYGITPLAILRQIGS